MYFLGVPSFVGRALGYIPGVAAGMPPRSLTHFKRPKGITYKIACLLERTHIIKFRNHNTTQIYKSCKYRNLKIYPLKIIGLCCIKQLNVQGLGRRFPHSKCGSQIQPLINGKASVALCPQIYLIGIRLIFL